MARPHSETAIRPTMLQPPEATIGTAALDAFVEAIRVERDPCRQARLLAFVRKQRDHGPLREVAAELFEKEKHAPVSERRCYWAALEILTEPSPGPPAEGPLWIEPVSDVCFVRLRPGRFGMGSDSEDAYGDETPLHVVEITGEYWLGRHAVTNGEFGRYLAAKPKDALSKDSKDPRFKWIGQPVVGVSWEEAELGYCRWLREQPELKALRERTGIEIHLPTEAEWEYACRAGSRTEYCFGDGEWHEEKRLASYAWYGENWEVGSAHPVGLKQPNEWGLQDMHGNVCEWCWDLKAAYPEEPQRDPMGPAGPSLALRRVYRGGSWRGTACNCRSAYRFVTPGVSGSDFLGFRLALSPVRQPAAG